MWFSSGGTKSVVHTDSVDNILCVFRGDKEFVLVNPHKYAHRVGIATYYPIKLLIGNGAVHYFTCYIYKVTTRPGKLLKPRILSITFPGLEFAQKVG